MTCEASTFERLSFCPLLSSKWYAVTKLRTICSSQWMLAFTVAVDEALATSKVIERFMIELSLGSVGYRKRFCELSDFRVE
jgi:hypothetical protein